MADVVIAESFMSRKVLTPKHPIYLNWYCAISSFTTYKLVESRLENGSVSISGEPSSDFESDNISRIELINSGDSYGAIQQITRPPAFAQKPMPKWHKIKN